MSAISSDVLHPSLSLTISTTRHADAKIYVNERMYDGLSHFRIFTAHFNYSDFITSNNISNRHPVPLVTYGSLRRLVINLTLMQAPNQCEWLFLNDAPTHCQVTSSTEVILTYTSRQPSSGHRDSSVTYKSHHAK